jgi:hypothetical protein
LPRDLFFVKHFLFTVNCCQNFKPEATPC